MLGIDGGSVGSRERAFELLLLQFILGKSVNRHELGLLAPQRARGPVDRRLLVNPAL